MKHKTLIYKTLAVIVIIFAIGGCSQEYIKNRQAATAQVGIEVFEATEALYDSIHAMNYYYQYNTDYLQILTNDSVGSAAVNQDNSVDKMLEFIHFVQKVYRSYDMLSDIEVGIEKSGIRPNFELLIQRLDSFDFDDNNKKILSELKLSVKAHKFEAKDLMYELSLLYLDLIDNDLAQRKVILQKKFDTYETLVAKVPASAFDIEKVKPLVKAPLKNDNDIIALYKMQLQKDAHQKQTDIELSLSTISKVVQTMSIIHAEFIKQDKSNVDIDQSTAKIKQQLNISE